MNFKKASVPDDDAVNWINTLREEGFSDEEVDYLMSRMNATYAKRAGIDVVEEELEEMERYLAKEHKRTLTPEQKRHMKKSLAEKFNRTTE